MTWGTPEEVERRKRIKVCVAAFAYEILDRPVMSDGDYDTLAHSIDPRVMTGHPVFDEFFLTQFEPFTGAWVRQHPDIHSLRRLYERHYRSQP